MAKLATVRSFLAVAVVKEWHVHHMNVKNAFLHGDLQEIVYVKLPPGYKNKGHRIEIQHEGEYCDASSDDKVCKLSKSLYGLKQAPRQWFAKLTTVLKECFLNNQNQIIPYLLKLKVTPILLY